jgi:hypothetical protein
VDGIFATDLFGDACEAPADPLRALLPAPLRCSRERPFGIHADLGGGRCPRCGWTPRRRRRAKS